MIIIITLFQEGETLRHHFQAAKKVAFCNVALSLSPFPHPLFKTIKHTHTHMHFGCRVDHEYAQGHSHEKNPVRLEPSAPGLRVKYFTLSYAGPQDRQRDRLCNYLVNK